MLEVSGGEKHAVEEGIVEEHAKDEVVREEEMDDQEQELCDKMMM